MCYNGQCDLLTSAQVPRTKIDLGSEIVYEMFSPKFQDLYSKTRFFIFCEASKSHLLNLVKQLNNCMSFLSLMINDILSSTYLLELYFRDEILIHLSVPRPQSFLQTTTFWRNLENQQTDGGQGTFSTTYSSLAGKETTRQSIFRLRLSDEECSQF